MFASVGFPGGRSSVNLYFMSDPRGVRVAAFWWQRFESSGENIVHPYGARAARLSDIAIIVKDL